MVYYNLSHDLHMKISFEIKGWGKYGGPTEHETSRGQMNMKLPGETSSTERECLKLTMISGGGV